MRSPGLVLVLLLTSLYSLGQFRPLIPNAEPAKNAVREFCRLDFSGARLTADGWSRIKPLTTWKDNPEWHGFTVVSRFEQQEASPSIHSAKVTVRYLVLGRYQPGAGFVEDPGAQSAEFRLKDVDGSWRIDSIDPMIEPHVSRVRAVEWLRTALATEKDPGVRAAMQKALEQLQPKQ